MKNILIILSIIFTIQINAATLSSQSSYTPTQDIKVNFNQMTGQNKNWIAIYKQDSSNDWENVIDWKWAKGVKGTSTFNKLPQGNYEVRAFYNNSFSTEANLRFSVKKAIRVKAKLEPTKGVYLSNQVIVVNFSGLSQQTKDWIAIYKEGTSNDWENVIDWKWAEDFEGTSTFKRLSIGRYEVRAFYNNSFKSEVRKVFTVISEYPDSLATLAKKLAIDTCIQGRGMSTSNALCPQQHNNKRGEKIYVLVKEQKEESTVYGHYVTDASNAEPILIKKSETPAWEMRTSEHFVLPDLAETPLYVTVTQTDEADERGSYNFYNGQEVVLSFYYVERERRLFNIHTYDNGRTLEFQYKIEQIDEEEGIYTTTYDISNPAKPKFLKVVKKPLY